MKIFIPIKENSQRVPEKNFRIFGDEPLYKYQLLRFEDFEITVDTDSTEIFDTINSDKKLDHVTAYMRDESLIGDEVSVNKLIKHYIENYHSHDEWICQIHVTSPFLKEETIINTEARLNSEDYDSAAGVNIIHSRLWRQEKYGVCPINHNPMKLEQTQDLERIYEENSAFYIFKPQSFLNFDNRIGTNPLFIETPFPQNLDIDTEDDWRLCNEVALATNS